MKKLKEKSGIPGPYLYPGIEQWVVTYIGRSTATKPSHRVQLFLAAHFTDPDRPEQALDQFLVPRQDRGPRGDHCGSCLDQGRGVGHGSDHSGLGRQILVEEENLGHLNSSKLNWQFKGYVNHISFGHVPKFCDQGKIH